MSALNPLDQAAMNQVMKTAGQTDWQKLVGVGKAMGKGFSPRAYFKGLTRGAGGGFKRPPRADRLYNASVRKNAAIGLGAWGGLNMMDPNSGGTWAVNTAAAGSAYVAAMPAVGSLAAKYGGAAAGKISGGYKIAGGALLANRILGVV